MTKIFRIVASLGYLVEFSKKSRQRLEGIGRGRRGIQNDSAVLGAIKAHLDNMRDMAVVLERMKGLAQRLGSCGRRPSQTGDYSDMDWQRGDQLDEAVSVVASTVISSGWDMMSY